MLECVQEHQFCLEDLPDKPLVVLRCSVNRGWNVIDTASNYRGGRAEKAVGHALLALRTASVGITRGMLFVR